MGILSETPASSSTGAGESCGCWRGWDHMAGISKPRWQCLCISASSARSYPKEPFLAWMAISGRGLWLEGNWRLQYWQGKKTTNLITPLQKDWNISLESTIDPCEKPCKLDSISEGTKRSDLEICTEAGSLQDPTNCNSKNKKNPQGRLVGVPPDQ